MNVTGMDKSFIGNVWQSDRYVFKLNKQYLACDIQTDIKNNLIKLVWQMNRHEKKMSRGVFSKNIWEGASERQNENIIVSKTLKNPRVWMAVILTFLF